MQNLFFQEIGSIWESSPIPLVPEVLAMLEPYECNNYERLIFQEEINGVLKFYNSSSLRASHRGVRFLSGAHLGLLTSRQLCALLPYILRN